MTDFRSKKGGTHYPITPRKNSIDHDDKWIQGSIKHPGRVTEYVRREYGDKAFEKGANGKEKIKYEYLLRARDLAREHGNRSLEDAINLAITLRHDSDTREKGHIMEEHFRMDSSDIDGR